MTLSELYATHHLGLIVFRDNDPFCWLIKEILPISWRDMTINYPKRIHGLSIPPGSLVRSDGPMTNWGDWQECWRAEDSYGGAVFLAAKLRGHRSQ